MLGGNCLVKLDEEFLAGLHERKGSNEANALGDIERVPVDIVGVVALHLGQRRGVTFVEAACQGVHAARRRGADAVALLCVVHLIKRLHSCANLLAGDLLVKGEYEPVSAGTVFPGNDERVELGVSVIGLSPEG